MWLQFGADSEVGSGMWWVGGAGSAVGAGRPAAGVGAKWMEERGVGRRAKGRMGVGRSEDQGRGVVGGPEPEWMAASALHQLYTSFTPALH